MIEDGVPWWLVALAILVPGGLAIYEMRARRRAQHTLETFAERVPAAIAHVVGNGAELKYRFVNRRYAELYGFTPGAVIGRHPRQILGGDVFGRAEANMKRAIGGETVVFDLLFKGRTLEVTYAPDNREPGFLGIIRDVTDERQRRDAG